MAKRHLVPIRRFLVIDLKPGEDNLHTIKLSTDSHQAAGTYIDTASEPCALIDTFALNLMAEITHGANVRQPVFAD